MATSSLAQTSAPVPTEAARKIDPSAERVVLPKSVLDPPRTIESADVGLQPRAYDRRHRANQQGLSVCCREAGPNRNRKLGTGGFGGAYDGTRWPEDYLKRKRSDELRGDASLSLQPAPEPMPPAPRPGVVQAEPFHEQSNFQGEYIDPSLLATLRRFEQSRGWQIGGGGLFSFGWNHSSRLMVHCGPSFKSPREAFEGERCFGVLLRFDLGRRKPAH